MDPDPDLDPAFDFDMDPDPVPDPGPYWNKYLQSFYSHFAAGRTSKKVKNSKYQLYLYIIYWSK